jgi:hypothetical protein
VEVSPVMRGASPETETVGVKAVPDSEEKSDLDTVEVERIKTEIEILKLQQELNKNG